MNNDLISRKALKAEVKAWSHDALDLRTISQIIDSAPAEDAEPVKRGAWVYVDDGIALRCKCSVCGESRNVHTKRCCTCGAKMEESDI